MPEEENTWKESLKLKPGSQFTIEVNQGKRDAIVLAILGDEAIAEYFMPKGTTSLIIIDVASWDKKANVSYYNVPLKWLEAMYKEGAQWKGVPQGALRAVWDQGQRVYRPVPHRCAPSIKETYEQRLFAKKMKEEGKQTLLWEETTDQPAFLNDSQK